MEDDEGYTVLNLRPKRGNSASPSPDGRQEFPMSPRCYKIALGALGACCIILTLAGITLGAWVFQCPAHEEQVGAAGNTSLEELVSHLRQRLCDMAPGSSADGSGCKVCPRDWLPHRDKCYWVSKESMFWSESFKDCEMRTSQMLVIQDREEMVKKLSWGFNFARGGFVIVYNNGVDVGVWCCVKSLLHHCIQRHLSSPMGISTTWGSQGHEENTRNQRIIFTLMHLSPTWQEFIQNITQGTNLVWIGLTIKSPEKKWTWVDTSPLDQSLFPVTGSAEGNSCGMIRRNRINSESCNTEFKWICQMEAILL
ncbi:killer cell lectin-like receptor subfamily F member 1 [Macrochelys suwanniensis]